jgi:hypothetical protein
MKKHYTHLFTFLLITLTNLSFAQVDWAIKSIKSPTELESTSTGTNFAFTLEFENRGNTIIKEGDSVVYSMILVDIETGALFLEYPQNAGRGASLAFVLDEDVNPNSTYDLTLDLSSQSIVTRSRNVRMGVISYLFDRTSPEIDSDSSNNTIARDLVWWNQQRWNVSVEDIAYNSNNIAIYPNPANDQLNVNLLFAESNAVNIELFDLTGKAVATPNMNQAISPNQYTLDVADLTKGVYILKVTNGTKVSTSKVTISH